MFVRLGSIPFRCEMAGTSIGESRTVSKAPVMIRLIPCLPMSELPDHDLRCCDEDNLLNFEICVLVTALAELTLGKCPV